MFSKVKISALTFLFGVSLALAAQAPAAALGCAEVPIVDIINVETERIYLRFNERCTGEDWSKLWARGESGGWSRLIINFGDWNGWRGAWDEDLDPGREYCYNSDSLKDGYIKTSSTVCETTLPKTRLGLVSESVGCTLPTTTPNEDDQREHVYITQGMATALGINSSHVTINGPSPQIRLTIDAPLMTNNAKSSVNYTVVGICTGEYPLDWRVWMWNDDKLALPTDKTLSDVSAVTVSRVAPSRTTWTDNGSAATVENHFTEPNASASGQKFFREKVTMVDNKEVALLIPHGGGIDVNTSVQAQAFVSRLGAANVNVWEAEGQWGDNQTHDRWHLNASDIHTDSFPGLARLLAKPEYNDPQNQEFRYAVALHGFKDQTGVGLILGGRAPADVLCHVAQSIRDEAGTRANEIGLHIANAGTNGQDIRLANASGYLPNLNDSQALEGTAQDNIVSRVSRAQAPGSSTVTWGSIQLEQSLPLRKEMDYGFADANGDGVNDFCTANDGADCLHNIVVHGVANAIAELVDDVNPANPAGACCTHFSQRCP